MFTLSLSSEGLILDHFAATQAGSDRPGMHIGKWRDGDINCVLMLSGSSDVTGVPGVVVLNYVMVVSCFVIFLPEQLTSALSSDTLSFMSRQGRLLAKADRESLLCRLLQITLKSATF